jgi:ribonucleotide reductase beta subunit family protein with ferritin-like domain
MMKDSLKNHWVPEETPMGGDKQCFDLTLNPVEQEMFLDVFATLTTSDIVILRNVAMDIMQHVTAPEVTAYLTRQCAEELVHTFTYQYCIEILGLNQDDIYTRYLTIPEVKAKFDYAEEWATKIFKFGSLDELISGLVFYYTMFEGVWFYNGFSPIYSLQRRNLMTGTGTQLQYIQRDECLSEDTELLTPNGWVSVGWITQESYIAQWNNETGAISFIQPQRLSIHKSDTAYLFKSKQGHVNQLVSENHRVCYVTKTGNLKVVSAKEATLNPYTHIINAAKAEGSIDTLSPRDRLILAIQADGYISPRYSGVFCGTVPAKFSFSKERKIERLEAICESLRLELEELPYLSTSGCRNFKIDVPISLKPTKFLPDAFSLENKSYLWCQEFIEEVGHWDGHFTTEDRIHYGCTVKENADFVQAVATLAGYRTLLTCTPDDRKETYSDYYRLHICKHVNTTQGGAVIKEQVPYTGTFYGVQVPSSFLVIRRGGGVSITGNSNHVAFGIRLIKELCKEESYVLRPSLIYPIFERAIELESDYAFRTMPPTLGYNGNLHVEQAKFLANRRLRQLGLEPLFEAECVLPWLDEQINIKKEKNFFETRVTEYQSSLALDGTWDD